MRNRVLIKIEFLGLVIGIVLILLNDIVYAEDFEYDENGRVIIVPHDDGSYTEYEYDKNGNIVSVTTIDSKTETSSTQNRIDSKNKNDEGTDTNIIPQEDNEIVNKNSSGINPDNVDSEIQSHTDGDENNDNDLNGDDYTDLEENKDKMERKEDLC